MWSRQRAGVRPVRAGDRLAFMPEVELNREGAIAFREALPEVPESGDPVLLIHGFPQSSYMWAPVLAAIAKSGRRAIAPDLSGYGDSPPDPPGTWEHHVGALETFRRALGLERVALGLHDWGGMIGLRWACDHPDAVSALILSNTGFFADTEWHAMAQALRTPGQGEQLLDNLTKQAFATMVRDQGGRIPEDAMDEYWKAFTSPAGRQGMLELYRSGDFDKLKPYEGQLEAMGVPTLILWGPNDPVVPVAAARRFNREISNSKLVILEDASHFLYDDEPARCAREIVAFLEELP
jgi:haloalkane dehalogenase